MRSNKENKKLIDKTKGSERSYHPYAHSIIELVCFLTCLW